MSQETFSTGNCLVSKPWTRSILALPARKAPVLLTHEGFVLLLRNRILRHVERLGDLHFMLFFDVKVYFSHLKLRFPETVTLLLLRRRTHQESTRGNQHELHLHAVAQIHGERRHLRFGQRSAGRNSGQRSRKEILPE